MPGKCFRVLALLLILPRAYSIAAGPSAAESQLESPVGKVVLTIIASGGGQLSRTNGPNRASFDLAMLEKLPKTEVRTTTPWIEGTNTYSGPKFSVLLDAVGAQGKDVLMTALNDYIGQTPMEDLRKWNVIIAIRKNGEIIRVRDKGPLMVIYPFDEHHKDLFNEIYFCRSVWQLKSIEVK